MTSDPDRHPQDPRQEGTDPACDSNPVVLLVEDDGLLLMEASDTLAEAGFTVLEAPHADEALQVLEFADGKVMLDNGAKFILDASRTEPGDIHGVGLDYKELPRDVEAASGTNSAVRSTRSGLVVHAKSCTSSW